MNKKLKLSALAMMVAAVAVTAQAQDSLLQAVSIDFTFYTQGLPLPNASGGTNNIVNHQGFGSKELIKALTGSPANRGDTLVRVTPAGVLSVTNLVPAATNTLVITNISTSYIISNNFILNGVTTYIGNTNVTFGTNITNIDGVPVTLGTNAALVASPGTIESNYLGTNTTVTTTTWTNSTNYTFVANTLAVSSVTNKTGPGSWAIYNTVSNALSAIPAGVDFDIHTSDVYDDGTNLAYTHGETIKHDGEIEYGTTDEIRTLVLSNATMNIKLSGYAHGHVVPISLNRTGTNVVYSQDYNWSGEGSGVISNNVPTVIEGGVSEDWFKLLTQ